MLVLLLVVVTGWFVLSVATAFFFGAVARLSDDVVAPCDTGTRAAKGNQDDKH